MVSTGDVITPALKQRVIRILKDPAAEWPVIEREPASTEKLYREYIAVLAAIPAIASFIGMSLVGITVPFLGTIRTPILSGIVQAVLVYVFTLAGVYVSALVVNKLAPQFESKPDEMQALKLVAYASTAAWVAGVLNIIPALGLLAVLGGLYSVYLFYVGLPVMMKTPQPKAIPYMLVSAVVIILVNFVALLLAGVMTGASRTF